MEITLVIVACVLCIGAGFLFSKLKSKGLIDETSLRLTSDILLALKIITDKYIKEDRKDVVSAIFDVLRDSIAYAIEQEHLSKELKAELAYSTIIRNLETMGVEVDFETELLIEIVISNSLGI